ncbi:MAG: Hsp33 family molecular chaperone HslO [Ferrovibrio sp.]|nr:Hsp33 family molecular chaperone HslO [Ferrovibrio sp.]
MRRRRFWPGVLAADLTPELTDDLSQPFQVEACDVRGRLVRLGAALDDALAKHDYPNPVAQLVAEAVALAATMATALKFDGIFTLQAKGDGPVSLLVADYRTGTSENDIGSGALRGYASFDAERLAGLELGPGPEPRTAPVPLLLGKGYLAFTIDPAGEDMERYQGIVDLSGANLAEAAHAYFAQSEQLAARVSLGAARVAGADGRRRWRAGGLLVQQLPAKAGGLGPEEREEAWERVKALTATAKVQEFCDPALPPHDLLYRLYHEDGVRVYEPMALAARCTCNADRILGILRSFTAEEINHIVADGQVAATCQFCSETYRFPAEMVQNLP